MNLIKEQVIGRILALAYAIWLSAPAFAMSGTICGLGVVSDQGLDSTNFVYYQVDAFLPEYNLILSKSHNSNDECWAEVEELLKNTDFIKDYGFSRDGAPLEFRRWYTDWFEGNFNDPNAIRSSFPGAKSEAQREREI